MYDVQKWNQNIKKIRTRRKIQQKSLIIMVYIEINIREVEMEKKTTNVTNTDRSMVYWIQSDDKI